MHTHMLAFLLFIFILLGKNAWGGKVKVEIWHVFMQACTFEAF